MATVMSRKPLRLLVCFLVIGLMTLAGIFARESMASAKADQPSQLRKLRVRTMTGDRMWAETAI